MRDIYAETTNSIIKSIEDNPGKVILPWQRNGSSGLPVNIDTDNSYRGVNIVMLWCAIEESKYSSNTFGTYKQWGKKDCQVRKGEKASPIIFYKELFVEEDGKQKKIPMLRSSTVFNADQVDGYEPPNIEDHGPVDRIKAADAFVERTKATILHGGSAAYYHRKRDDITMPDEQRFFDTQTATRTESYYSTLLHELTHWSGAEHRLNREKGRCFGDDKYAFEELIAELGAAFLCAKLTIEKEPRTDHAAYIANWLEALKGDKKFIFSAAARAQDAVDYLCEL